jgi:rubrerythrin
MERDFWYDAPSSRGRKWVGPMEEFIARENIRRFEAQLESSDDEDQKAEIKTLLEAERQHLRQIRRAKMVTTPKA